MMYPTERPPVAETNPPNLSEQSVDVPVEVSDASMVSVPREVVVHFCRFSWYAVAPCLILGMPVHDLFLGGGVMIPPFEKATFNMLWRLKLPQVPLVG